jgi:hypothetical protein
MTGGGGGYPAWAEVLDGAAPVSVSADQVVLRLFLSSPTEHDGVVEAAGRVPALLRHLDAVAAAGRSRRLCVVVPDRKGVLDVAAIALVETLVRYGAAHLVHRPVQVNLVRHPPTPEGERRAAAMTAALFGGRLDAVRGQVFTLRDIDGGAL